MGQKIFLARHGERADLADPRWAETAEVRNSVFTATISHPNAGGW